MKTTKKIKCDIPNCHMDAKRDSLFCGPHDEIKIPKDNTDKMWIKQNKELK